MSTYNSSLERLQKYPKGLVYTTLFILLGSWIGFNWLYAFSPIIQLFHINVTFWNFVGHVLVFLVYELSAIFLTIITTVIGLRCIKRFWNS